MENNTASKPPIYPTNNQKEENKFQTDKQELNLETYGLNISEGLGKAIKF